MEEAGSPSAAVSGKPNASTDSPWAASPSASPSGLRPPGAAGAQQREVVARRDADHLCLALAPARGDEEAVAPVDHVRGGDDEPGLAVEHPAAPSPLRLPSLRASIRTVAGATSRTTAATRLVLALAGQRQQRR